MICFLVGWDRLQICVMVRVMFGRVGFGFILAGRVSVAWEEKVKEFLL